MPRDDHRLEPAASGADACELCGRSGERLTRHHLIPRTRHSNRHNKRTFARAEVHGRVAQLCVPCHRQVHAVLDEKELERSFNTLERLRAVPEIAAFVEWVRRRPPGTKVPTRRRRRRG